MLNLYGNARVGWGPTKAVIIIPVGYCIIKFQNHLPPSKVSVCTFSCYYGARLDNVGRVYLSEAHIGTDCPRVKPSGNCDIWPAGTHTAGLHDKYSSVSSVSQCGISVCSLPQQAGVVGPCHHGHHRWGDRGVLMQGQCDQ